VEKPISAEKYAVARMTLLSPPRTAR